MDPHPLHHNPLPPWAQPPPPTATAAAVPYSAVPFPHPDAAVMQQHHNYVPQQQQQQQQPFPNFAAPAVAIPVPTAPSPTPTSAPTPSPTPAPAPAAAVVQTSAGFHSAPLPSYAEMIFSAISALKERDGSSKRAIAKYLEHAYQGQLPASHQELLTANLKRLKVNGMLVMVKKSYKLPRSDFTANINDLPDPSLDSSFQPLPSPTQQPQSAGAQLSASVGTKRGRGRPPKVKPTTAETGLPNGQPQLVSQPVVDSQPPGFPANGQLITGHYSADVGINVGDAEQGTQAVMVPIGLAGEDGSGSSVKRRPGRPPKKLLGVDASEVVIRKKGRGRPPNSGMGLGLKKRSPGRHRKLKPKTVAAVSGTNGYKRRPGRPAKNQANSVAVPYASVETMALPSVPRPRGRPRKGTGSIAAGVGVGVLSEKRAGLGDGVMEVRRSGRPVGRPKKYVDESVDYESDSQEADFKRKLVFFQARVREAVGVLRPQLSHDPPSNVVQAVEELEKLASIDIEQELKAEHVMFTEQHGPVMES